MDRVNAGALLFCHSLLSVRQKLKFAQFFGVALLEQVY